MYVGLCVYMYVCMYVCMYVYLYVTIINEKRVHEF